MNLRSAILFIGFIGLFALKGYSQDPKEDEYSDYSYLWADEDDKKKKKKKKKKKDTVLTVQADTVINPSDSLLIDSLSQPSIVQPDTIPPDTTRQTEIELPVEEEVKEEKEKKPKREKAERPPISDFREPMVLPNEDGSINGGMTYTQIDGKDYVGLVLSPEFKLGKVGVGLNVPILYGLDDKSIRTEIFEDGVGAARLFRYVRYGKQKSDPVYVKAGEISGLMLGYGGLMNNYTNSTSYEKSKVGIHTDFNYDRFIGLEMMYSDLNPQSFNLFAARPYIRPLSSFPINILNTLEVGASYVVDKDQTDIITSDSTSTTYAFTKSGAKGMGFDMGITLLSSPFIQIDMFASYSRLNIQSDTLTELATASGESNFETGSGASVGVNFRMHFIADVFSTDVRIERLNNSDHYQPQFFNATYEINKDARIASLIGIEGKNGIYGSLRGHVLKKVSLGGSLMIPDDISASSPAFVELTADMERLADKFSFHGNYVKGDLDDLGDAFKLDERSLAKMRFIYHMNKFLATGVDYYWLFTPTAEGGFEATKYVMPYFGVSISL
ncbi:hypothetical protein SAMN05421640_1164 [Ekhidna lutea]|uniref:Uncharacterized protein n=1 Tax=Ekhidna lutea TaxID=447679 RepID=A0A239H681_EKHLU|nr:hypothetical protein [Ekhidna lutea]SNS76946.1 hypothetical protein SAMN05421640_1164 [Ekhidna lutea]